MKAKFYIPVAFAVLLIAGCESKPKGVSYQSKMTVDIDSSRTYKCVIMGENNKPFATLSNNKWNITNYDSALTILFEESLKMRHELKLVENILSHINANGYVNPKNKEDFDESVILYWHYKGFTPEFEFDTRNKELHYQ